MLFTKIKKASYLHWLKKVPASIPDPTKIQQQQFAIVWELDSLK